MTLVDEYNARAMSQEYDHEEVVDREIWPLIQEVHKRCEELGIPFFATICHTNTGDTHISNTAHHFNGIERMPMTYPAFAMIQENPEFALKVMAMAMGKELARHQSGTLEA